MNKQHGFVSIITTSIIMIIITLIVIGFSQLMQREQRQALDRQLSSQALYAAETGINDFFFKLQNGDVLIDDEENLDNCDVSGWPNGGVINPDSNNEAAYTCILYDKSPASIDFNNGSVTTQQSKIFPIEPKANNSNAQVKELTFSWSGARGNTDLTLPEACVGTVGVNELPRTTPNPGVPILRVDLVKVPKGVPINLNTAIEDSTHFFLYPKGPCGDTESDYQQEHTTEADKGKVIEVACQNTNGYACEYTLDGMNTMDNGSNRYFARIKSIYNDADVRITGRTSAAGGGGTIEFIGAQVALDVTGKSNDVLRRVKVQLGNPQYPVPEFVFQGLRGVCKAITIEPPLSAPIDTACD
jgi:Tfp pilus assembly protein PilX